MWEFKFLGKMTGPWPRPRRSLKNMDQNLWTLIWGCPVRKVVSNGGGSALLKDTQKLPQFFKSIKKVLQVPLTIKIRTGWDQDHINALEVCKIAAGEGIEFVAIHGRTRVQQYKGEANWELLEEIKKSSPLPVIGNGDLHTDHLVRSRLAKTQCDALMLGRGPIRDPFIFLKAYQLESDQIHFSAKDYLEVIYLYNGLLEEQDLRPRHHLIQLRKHVVWFSHGFPGVAKFRQNCFQTESTTDVLKLTEDYFEGIESVQKMINPSETFMAGGHG